jgi:hypothetical protein
MLDDIKQKLLEKAAYRSFLILSFQAYFKQALYLDLLEPYLKEFITLNLCKSKEP